MAIQLKRKHFYFLEKHYTDWVVWTLPAFAKARITPNQITIANFLNGFLIFGLIAYRQYLPAALLIQLYLFLDILDGNLARYRGMSTKLGGVLDHIGDRLFYNGVILVIGLTTSVHWIWIVLFLLAHNLHSLAATYYIVPAIRKMDHFQRFGLKKALMDRGYILGMDLSSQDLIMSALIATPWRDWILPIVTTLYFADLVYRLAELERNRKNCRSLPIS